MFVFQMFYLEVWHMSIFHSQPRSYVQDDPNLNFIFRTFGLRPWDLSHDEILFSVL